MAVLGVSTDSARGPETTGITGINRITRTRERAARLVGLAARFMRDGFENPQVNGLISALEELSRHHHPLDLVGALVDLGVLRGLPNSAPWQDSVARSRPLVA